MSSFKALAVHTRAVAEKLEAYGLSGGDSAFLKGLAKQLEEFQVRVLTEVQDGALTDVTILSSIEFVAMLAHFDVDNEGSDYEEISVYVRDASEQDEWVKDHLNPMGEM